jgi:hypothetical protein
MRKFRAWHLVWFALAGLAVLVWLYQGWLIAGYRAEFRRQMVHPPALPGVPREIDFDPFDRLLDPRIAAADSLQHWSLIAVVIFGLMGLACLAPRLARVFLVRLSGGVATVVEGRVPPGFLAELADCCRDASVLAGEVWGQFTPRGTRLMFSDNIPAGLRQRLRNVWVLYSRGPKRR